jgi:hypothetical protein
MIEVGGGVVIQVPGTRFRVTLEVIEIDENSDMLRVRGEGVEGWITQGQVQDVLTPSNFAFDNAINIIGED